ncbi:MAG TPA: N-acetyltransferase [Caldilineaceae bacterium]|nr:N-acetyltransferase [Caldilineaceae bacterium]
MPITIRPATEQDIPAIVEMVNRFAAQNLMLPRSEASVRQTLADWLVADDRGKIAGCGSLVPLTETLVEIRSLAIHEDYQGQGIGGQLVLALVEMARAQEYEQVCALTLRERFFTRLGFEVVDRWSISPKVWQACIYCPKFHRCDEIAVLMNLVEKPAKSQEGAVPAWNGLLRWDAWQPLKLAYQQRPAPQEQLEP